jgi:hypothetical protein
MPEIQRDDLVGMRPDIRQMIASLYGACRYVASQEF